MKENRTAARANELAHDAMAAGEYASLAPHLCHPEIRALYADLVGIAVDAAARHSSLPQVLDLGAGDGSATISFLRHGCHVLAVDISENQLAQLQAKCGEYGARLEVRKGDMSEVLMERRQFDIVVMNSVLHHVPDYMAVVELVTESLAENGVFFSFQDPKWKSSLSYRDAILSGMAFLYWRLGREDVLAGIWRRIRRMAGVYYQDSVHDNSEYHAVRKGVNQMAIRDLFLDRGFDCQLVEYCSFHSGRLQPLGERLGVRNTFAMVAGRNLPRFNMPLSPPGNG